MADKNITDALKQLDPSNDDHWTASKQPKVDAVKELHGEDVTREQIDAAAEGFNRDTASGFFMNTSGGETVTKPWESGGEDPNSQDSGPTDQADAEKTETTALDGPDQNPGQNVDGDITGTVKAPDEVTAGIHGNNIDAEGDPSGVPSGTEIGRAHV